LAGGALALRLGGRAALISAAGLADPATAAEWSLQGAWILDAADAMDLTTKLVWFTAAWTVVKCLCLDAGGMVLALCSGVLFGDALAGGVVSAAAATVGSVVAYSLARLDTPVRKWVLQLLDEYPVWRGIEKVVARDGVRAILTLRLAPILPMVPIGMYNYIYGVTKVALPDLVLGTFLGGLKPYLLDSYLGCFGKSLLDGTAGDTSTISDYILLGVLGLSVLVGVFAAQLAGDTWDSVLQEVEAEKKAKLEKQLDASRGEGDDVARNLLGWDLPDWMVGLQFSMRDADERMRHLVASELEAAVWSYTQTPPPANVNPATFSTSPEVKEANQGLDVVASICDGLVLAPILLEIFWAQADPVKWNKQQITGNSATSSSSSSDDVKMERPQQVVVSDAVLLADDESDESSRTSGNEATLLLTAQLNDMRSQTQDKIALLDERLKKLFVG
jgi:uncharacterized membrane protein YdjX (TVP38/TMEM64 family)